MGHVHILTDSWQIPCDRAHYDGHISVFFLKWDFAGDNLRCSCICELQEAEELGHVATILTSQQTHPIAHMSLGKSGSSSLKASGAVHRIENPGPDTVRLKVEGSNLTSGEGPPTPLLTSATQGKGLVSLFSDAAFPLIRADPKSVITAR